MSAEYSLSQEGDSILKTIAQMREQAGGDLASINRYISTRPEDVRAYATKATMLASDDEGLPRAIDFLREAERKFGKNYLISHLLGTMHEQSGKREQAIKFLREAADLNPYCPESLVSLATLLNRAERFPEAKKAWEEILKINPDLCHAWNGLARAEFHMGDLRRALNHTNAALITSEGTKIYDLILRNRPEIYLAMGNLESAITDDQRILSTNFNEGMRSIIRHPEFLVQRGRADLARAYVELAMQRIPGLQQFITMIRGTR